MLIENRICDKNLWLKEFKKKFSSFCNKLPLYVDYSIVGDQLLLLTLHFNCGQNIENIEYGLKFQQSVQQNISEIKNRLIQENYYPIIRKINIKNIPLSVEESQKLIEKGNVDPYVAVTLEKEVTNRIDYRVEKVHERENRISLRDLITKKIYLFSMKIPVVKFVELLNNNLREAELFFWENAKLEECLN